MRSVTHFDLSVLCCVVLLTSSSFSGEKIGPRLSVLMNESAPDDEIVAWVYFTDKGTHEFQKSSVPPTVVSERSLKRRMNVRPADQLVDYTDLPVDESYVQQVASQVIRVRQRSKWFNSVSVVATKEQIAAIASLQIVSSIELVLRFKKNQTEEELHVEPPQEFPKPDGNTAVYDFNYGLSLNQVQQINVPAVHNTGNYAQGVIVGVFDNGFRLLSHEAFDSLDIVAAYDFVSGDPNPAPQPGDPTSYGSHGVNTLSTIGGRKTGQLIGPAFGASYILARTENDSSETPIEEDYWAAAIEWADSIGVEVTSTSLGYLTYDPPYTSWTWQDMNGNITVITRAADMAVARGIVVCNSAGNDGYNSSHNTLGAPADGDSVITVGAVTGSGTRASFSSVGPTTSVPPRIKPDVMAQGTSVRVASASNPTGYGYSQGTSFSCPLAAGIAALIVRAHPNATPVQIADAMRNTASNSGSPNNLMGWGILNAVAAINYLGPTGTGTGSQLPGTYTLEQNYPNPFNPETNIRYELPEHSIVTLRIFDVLGREVRTLVNAQQAPREHTIAWNGIDKSGLRVASGVYFYRLSASSTESVGRQFTETRKLMVLQ